MAARLYVRLARRIRRAPLDAALALAVIGAALYVIAYPLAVVRYPPMTDLPFHAAQTSNLAQYLDPEWHFREQFKLQPLAMPYLSMYVIGAALMTFLPPVAAAKAAAAVMLALLPAGLAVMFHGMKRSPLLGVLGLGVVWSNLTHWGFLNFVGAIGLFAMSVGLALRLVERPSPGRQAALAAALLALFFTHVFRFPFALCAVIGAAVMVYPATRRLRPIALPIAPSLLLFVLWLKLWPPALQDDRARLGVHWERLREIPNFLFTSFTDAAEKAAAVRAGRVLLAAALIVAAARIWEWKRGTRAGTGAGTEAGAGTGTGTGADPVSASESASAARRRWFALGAGVVPVACAAVFLGSFLALPMQIGVWWYVYPREIVTALFIALGAFPDLPASGWIRAPVVVGLAAAAIGMGTVAADNYRQFDAATADFQAITRTLPQAPKLLYLVFDHGGSTRTTTPFIHLPAWVQAERGGWLSFHFANLVSSPLAYRAEGEPGAVVPPPVPLRWEWTPQRFDVQRNGAFFDWFLVRNRSAPDRLFAADPTVKRVDHVGTWWLYRREAAQ